MRPILPLLLALLACGCARRPETPTVVEAKDRKLLAHTHNSGFEYAHDTYNGMGAASDGKIYYVL